MLAGAMLLAAAPDPEPTVTDFLDHWAAVSRLAPAVAPLSSDYAWISDHVAGLARGYAAEVDAAKRDGKPLRACLPPAGQRSFNSAEVLEAFLQLAPGQREMPLKTGFYAFMDKRYPCPLSPASPAAATAPGTATAR